MGSLRTYPDTFKMKIPSRQFVSGNNPNVSKCKDCQTVLTDEYVKLEGQPIIDQYEPEDKEAIVSVYCEILRQVPPLDATKNVQYQLEDWQRGYRVSNTKEDLVEKMKEFKS